MKALNALLLLAASLAFGSAARAVENAVPALPPAGQNMYVIERTIPDAGKKSPDELKAISQKSCSVLRDLGPQIQWLHSYVTGNKIYCVYLAPDEDIVREHAKKGGFPVDSVSKVSTVISPKTAGE